MGRVCPKGVKTPFATKPKIAEQRNSVDRSFRLTGRGHDDYSSLAFCKNHPYLTVKSLSSKPATFVSPVVDCLLFFICHRLPFQ